jgi:two-component system cell cycle sensor histidine kinase/response regulator CckA
MTAQEVERFPFHMPPGRYVELKVIDVGEGMTDEVKAHLFEPFFTTKQAGKGTGMGLSTVYGIVKQSGGWILCDSEFGKGTTFCVLLPEAVGDLSKESVAPQNSAAAKGTGTILLAEDEDAVRELLATALSDLGYRVLAASNGEEALKIAGQSMQDIVLLITDTVMPRMGGEALAQSLREHKPDLKVLLISGYTESITEEVQPADQKTLLLQKPFSTALLNKTIKQLLNGVSDASASAG